VDHTDPSEVDESPTSGLDVPWSTTGSVTKAAMLVVLATCLIGTTFGLWWCNGWPVESPTVPNEVVVSTTSCSPGWNQSIPTERTFTVDNATHRAFEIQLVGGVRLASVYGVIRRLPPGTSRRLTASLPLGRFSWRCKRYNNDVVSDRLMVRGESKPLTVVPLATRS
jgi:hypothetical protein